MNVGIGTEVTQFLFWEYINCIFGSVWARKFQCEPYRYQFDQWETAYLLQTGSHESLMVRNPVFGVVQKFNSFVTMVLAEGTREEGGGYWEKESVNLSMT